MSNQTRYATDYLISTLLSLPDTSTLPDLTRTCFPAESTATESVYSLPLMVTLVCCSFECCSFLAWQPASNRQKNRRFFTVCATGSPPVRGSISPTKTDVSLIINSLICRPQREIHVDIARFELVILSPVTRPRYLHDRTTQRPRGLMVGRTSCLNNRALRLYTPTRLGCPPFRDVLPVARSPPQSGLSACIPTN